MKLKLKVKSTIILFTVLSIFSFNLFAEESLPFGYKNIELGLTLDATKTELLKNPEFGYRGDRDVSLIPGDYRVLIETDASRKKASYFTQCWFQFYREQLYTITLNINPQKMDYYSMFTTLTKKYGDPATLDPQKAVWKNEDITMILEKPLSIKYIDNQITDELANYSTIEKSAEEISRQNFLDEF